jgi:hypothetical protein
MPLPRLAYIAPAQKTGDPNPALFESQRETGQWWLTRKEGDRRCVTGTRDSKNQHD